MVPSVATAVKYTMYTASFVSRFTRALLFPVCMAA